jgi:hypothetical protein
MVSNLGIEKDKEMSKLRPPVDLLGGFFNILQYIQTLTLLYSWTWCDLPALKLMHTCTYEKNIFLRMQSPI